MPRAYAGAGCEPEAGRLRACLPRDAQGARSGRQENPGFTIADLLVPVRKTVPGGR